MLKKLLALLSLALLTAICGSARADEYQDTINVFRKAVESAKFFQSAHGYAVFPTIGKGGMMPLRSVLRSSICAAAICMVSSGKAIEPASRAPSGR